MKLKIPEKAVMKAISEYLGAMENLGKVAWWTRHNSGLIFGLSYKGRQRAIKLGRVADPDFIGILASGRFFAIEAKSSEGKATEAQLDTLLKIKRTGAISVLAYSVEDVAKALN